MEARSLSLSHSHLALERSTDGEGTGMDVRRAQPERQRRAEPALSGQEDVIGKAGKGTAMQREQREHTQRLRDLNREAVFREDC